ncbi:MAG: SDR family oxidoreductase, partial [Bacteroidota bacterium]
ARPAICRRLNQTWPSRKRSSTRLSPSRRRPFLLLQRMTIDLTGTTALVTGATRGIGRAVAKQLVASGARVALHHSGRSPEAAQAQAEALGGIALASDLRDPRNAQSLWRETMEALGCVDVVVANAGVFVEAPPEADLDVWLEAWDTTVAVNLTSLAVLAKEALAHWAERHAASGAAEVVGRLVTVSSRAAFRGDDPAFLAYAASKGGVVSLTKSIARGWGRRGVAAFGVAPGFVRTDMASGAIAADAAGLDAQTALGRIAEPEEVAPTVVFLASGLADHATGTTVDVNGASYVR